MVDEDPPDDFPSEPPSGGPPPKEQKEPRESVRESVRSRFESIIPEILKRAVELGVEKARESPDNLKQFVHDLKVPKEVAHLIFQQIDDTKNGLFRVVAKELRDFLEHTNFSGEMQKLLTTVQFEINTTIRFTPNDGRSAKSEGEDGENAADASDTESKEGESGAREDAGRQPLPKPEIKTAVHVRRDDPERRRRRGSRSGA